MNFSSFRIESEKNIKNGYLGIFMGWFDEFYTEKYDVSLPLKDRTSLLKAKMVSKYIRPKSKILVLGCGPGYECKVLKKIGHEVVGVDINPEMLELAKPSCDEVYRADVTKRFPFKARSFDCCLAFELIEHLAFVDNFIKECKRVLKENGILILSTPSQSYWKNRLKVLLGKDILSDEHPRLFTPESLTEKLREHGFRVIKIIGIGKMGRFLSVKFPFLSLCGDFIMISEKGE